VSAAGGRWLVAAAVLGMGVLGVGLRFAALDAPVLWHDEVYTRIFVSGYQADDWHGTLYDGVIRDVDEVLAFTRRRPGGTALDTVRGLIADEPQHPPLYYLLARAWTAAVGEGTAALRALSAALGALCVPAAGWLGAEASGSRRPENSRPAAWAAALFAASPFFVAYAQEAREYALWTLLTLLSCATLLRAARRTEAGADARADWVLFSLLTALSLYTSLSSAAVIAAQGLHALNRGGRVLRWTVGAMAASGLAFAPWAGLVWAHREAVRASMAWSTAISVPWTETLGMLARNAARPLVDGEAALLVVGAVAVALWGLWRLRSEPGRARSLVALLVAVPVVLLVGPDLLFGGIRSLSARYLTPAWIGVLLALALAVERRPRVGGALIVVGLGSALLAVGRVDPWTKSISRGLPRIAEIVADAPAPLVVGNRERHHPGNLVALCALLPARARVQLLDHGAAWTAPEGYDVFLYSPIPQQLEALPPDVRAERVYEDVHASLWRLSRAP
jgi:uncharacterized membrane protein